MIHNIEGADQEYGYYGQGDVYGAGNTHGGAFKRRSITYVPNGPVNPQAKRLDGTEKHKFTTTGVPQYIQYFHDPGLSKTIALSG
jgi:hypothetical protein